MTFRARMSSFTSGIRPTCDLAFRSWEGMVADLWCAEGDANGHGHYVSPDPRIVVVLESGPSPLRLQAADPAQPVSGSKVAFVPLSLIHI